MVENLLKGGINLTELESLVDALGTAVDVYTSEGIFLLDADGNFLLDTDGNNLIVIGE